jgi:hypothetical protein
VYTQAPADDQETVGLASSSYGSSSYVSPYYGLPYASSVVIGGAYGGGYYAGYPNYGYGSRGWYGGCATVSGGSCARPGTVVGIGWAPILHGSVSASGGGWYGSVTFRNTAHH